MTEAFILARLNAVKHHESLKYYMPDLYFYYWHNVERLYWRLVTGWGN